MNSSEDGVEKMTSSMKLMLLWWKLTLLEP